jgi:hypothetical protein
MAASVMLKRRGVEAKLAADRSQSEQMPPAALGVIDGSSISRDEATVKHLDDL